jgi:regulator of sigma E protease
MMKMAGQFAREGFAEVMNFIALISLQLALINLLPIPALDGGHLLFLGIESILRRPVSVRARVVVQQIGMALLLALMVFIVINDVQKLFK